MPSRFTPPAADLRAFARERAALTPRTITPALSEELVFLSEQAAQASRDAAARFDLTGIIDAEEATP